MISSEHPIAVNLIKAAIKGGVPEADDLIRVVWPRAYRIAFSIVRNHTLAEDAAQEACSVLFRSIGQLRSVEAFGVWFYRIVVRQAVSLEKRNAPMLVEPDQGFKSNLEDALLRVDICNALALLTQSQRIAIALHYYAEMNSREIADVLGLKDSSIRFHLMKAKRTLEQVLRGDGKPNAYLEVPRGAA